MPILFFQQNYWVRMNGQNQIDRPQAPVVSISEWLVGNQLDYDDSAGQSDHDVCVGIQLKHQSE